MTTTITVLGSGRVGGNLAAALATAGHHVTVGVRNAEEVRNQFTNTPISVTDTTTAIASSEIIINATPGDSSLERLTAEREPLADKVLFDVSNASVRGEDGLPGALLYPETSLGELLQTALPATAVVKGLNTMLFSVMTDPAALTAPPTAFLSANDDQAKSLVRGLLRDLGWQEHWIVDLGGITTARGTEAMALMVPSLLGVLGFVPFALSVAR